MANFVPAADEVHRLQTGNDDECLLFQKVGEQGHYAGRTYPSRTRQGTYATSPSGILLASINSNNAERIAEMLERALVRWKELTREERLLPEDPATATRDLRRTERYYPVGGLVLRVNSRDLARAEQVIDRHSKDWNQDFAWFTKEEFSQFLPQRVEVGSKAQIPDTIIRRIALCHLIDNVRGQTRAFTPQSVEKASLNSEVVEIKGDIVSLRLEGESRTAEEGTWSIRGYADMNSPTPQKRGMDARLLGRAKFDRKHGRFTSFELVAACERWGGTQYNGRADDLAPAPLGIVFTLAGNTPAEHVAPAFFRAYGWQ